MKIHIVVGTSGDYEEKSWWNVCAFDTLERAVGHRDSLKESSLKRRAEYHEKVETWRESDYEGDSPKFEPDPRDPEMNEDASYHIEAIDLNP